MQTLLCALVALGAPGEKVEPLTGFPELNAPAASEPAPPEEEEIQTGWSGTVTLGLGLVTGNTETETVNLTADAEYRRKQDRTTLGALYIREEQFGLTTQDKQGARAQYDYFITDKTYVLGQAGYFADAIANLDSRLTAGAGAGHQFFEKEKLKLNGEAGLSYVDEVFDNATPDNEYWALRAAYNVAWFPSPAWEVAQSLSVFPELEDFSNYILNSDARVKVTLSDKLFAQLQWLHIFNETPAAGAERTDNNWMLSLGWSI